MDSRHWTCGKCAKVVLRRNMVSHLRVVHHLDTEECHRIRAETDRERGFAKVKCPVCDDVFVAHKELAQHCQQVHPEDGAEGRPQDYSVISLSFSSKREYESWFEGKCRSTCTSFFTSKTTTSGAATKKRLLCSRAGVYKRAGTEKVAISKKDVRYCSCYLTVDFNTDGSVSVEEHSMDYIIKRLRKEDPTRSTKLSFVVKSDLRNIVERYNMRPGWRHEDDVVSMRLRFEENNPADGIRVFEPPRDPSGAGFIMVIITPTMLEWLKRYSSRGVTLDDTFHTTRYNLKLATLMVADERDRGLPGAFLLSGSMTSTDVQKMFLEVRSLLPDFEPSRIVTDEAPCFYNGFKAVFPNAATRLHYCRFHILQTWERKTKQIVEAQLRPTVNGALQQLLKETRLEEFQKQFGEILAYLRAKNQREMAEYLEKNYLGRTPTWASFASKGAILDTTMISERFHLRIKEEFLHRNANSRIDGFVEMLIRSVEELSGAVDVKERRRFATCAYRLTETHRRHHTAEEIYGARRDLIVERNNHCLKCGVCAYSWDCTCNDNRLGISCPHRHAVKMILTTSSVREREGASSSQEAPAATVRSPISEAQKRQEECFQQLSALKAMYAVVEARANTLAKSGTEDAISQLKEAFAYVELAARALENSQTALIVARPEVAQTGANAKMPKIPLYRRGEPKKPVPCDEKPASLHEELRRLRDLSPYKGQQELE
ncbi:unnamed protein product [Nippostrongylus brasiliensis]|uniref:C2H2-type domain-containing protein n=1 Tax=Nippostrongylus brasiliensis TaxID=27835 RepID=A0A0N4YX31_NIPBR|nr:unnamed protein product [Nippostrongylus brasiliensis]